LPVTGNAHQARVQACPACSLEDAVLDQHRALRRVALVVDGQRAAAIGIVPSSTTVTPLAATRWPMRPAKAELPLRLKSPFEAVADRLVQQDAGPAGAEHHGHLAGRRRLGARD
jgi:hypothetical protein